MKTIPRTHKRKIDDIKARFTRCKSYSLETNFTGVACEASFAWTRLENFGSARLIEREAGVKYTIRIHGNCWYELTLPES